MNAPLDRWHKFVKFQDPNTLAELLADEVRFHSPFVWSPKKGKDVTKTILIAASETLKEFRYVREIVDKNEWALQFEARIGELRLRGIDLISLNEEGKICDFEVMIRPANALQAVGIEMSQRLLAAGIV